jgi:hypothetical protein
MRITALVVAFSSQARWRGVLGRRRNVDKMKNKKKEEEDGRGRGRTRRRW